MIFQEIVDLLTEKKVIRILGCTSRVFYTKLKNFPAPKSPEDWGAIEDISTRLGIDRDDLKILLEMTQTKKAALAKVKQDEKEQKQWLANRRKSL